MPLANKAAITPQFAVTQLMLARTCCPLTGIAALRGGACLWRTVCRCTAAQHHHLNEGEQNEKHELLDRPDKQRRTLPGL